MVVVCPWLLVGRRRVVVRNGSSLRFPPFIQDGRYYYYRN